MTSQLGPDAVAIEYQGARHEGDAIDPFLAELNDFQRTKVVVIFKDGLRVPLPKIDASTGDGAVRVLPSGKVMF